MSSIQETLNQKVQIAVQTALGEDFPQYQPYIVPATNPKFGDYQCNLALPLAKHLQQKPRDIAQTILDALPVQAICETPDIAGPGFINFKIRPDYLQQKIEQVYQDENLGVEATKHLQKVVVDFSSPNIAKEMHVGHLRSTIIGDSIARILEFRGNDVLRLNHVGDWGTQFGMLIAYLKEKHPQALTTANALEIGDLVAFYREAKQRFDADETFQQQSRQEVVKLQAGNEENVKAWQLICDQSRQEFQKIYDRLDVRLQERGESFYNPLLPDVIKDLNQAGILEENQGAQCVFLDGFTNKEGEPLPLIVQKSDGGYNYATTDLAALKYRIRKDEADRIIYVTDAGQANHFTQVFQTARKAGILPENVEVVHVPFGLVKGEDGKKFKTRSGETVRLKDLLDEAVSRVKQDLEQRFQAENRNESEEFKNHVAQVIGISAVKYADLSQNRTSDYIFSYDKMLSLQGNTAPYMLYAYVRIQGISRQGNINYSQLAKREESSLTHWEEKPPSKLNWKPIAFTFLFLLATFLVADTTIRVLHVVHSFPLLPTFFQLTGFCYTLWFIWKRLLFHQDRQILGEQWNDLKTTVLGDPQDSPEPETPQPTLSPGREPEILLQDETELALAKHLLQLTDVLKEVEQDLLPNRLCQYLFELSQKFNQFYDRCPVLQAEDPLRTSRLMLCDTTARTLKLGLSLLGIPVLERM
ncbi:arginine--tRNA ligase [Spirulina sp. CS-785/01]|uniref:arginine--tRNA ligase n=1 Tax=Spirulina sp. CS-785/01 TaxID=3021716 RepID=UPI002330E898|nr:arginine--tRNA ligase [Spirulina sp. CS-785/01]MDB9314666.1 arginine--tRNA ligase [Spirulina sp. CS-785/01]